MDKDIISIDKKDEAQRNKADWIWVKKYKCFKKLSVNYEFDIEIKDALDYKNKYNNIVKVKHKDCNRTFDIELSEWTNLHSTNRIVIDRDGTHLCIFCAQEKKNANFQEKLNSSFNTDFLLKGNFSGNKKSVTLYHKVCGNEFDIIPEYYRNKPITCKVCGKKDSTYERNETDRMNKELKDYLKDNNLSNYIPLEDFVGVSKKIKFKSISCGHVFKRAPNDLLKFAGKDVCPECNEFKFKSENQSDRNAYFQNELDKVHSGYLLVTDYLGQNSIVKVKHLKCDNIIDVNTETIRKKGFKCPHCESNNLKYSNYISLSEKINLYEKEVNFKYKILTPFVNLRETVTVRHIECNNEFPITMNTFTKGKYYEICPVCRKANRLKSAINKLESIHKDKYLLLNPEDFEGVTKPLKFKHLKCGSVIEKTFSALYSSKGEYCSECSLEITTTKKLKAYVFNRFKGEYTVASEYSKSSIPVKFRHKKCGRSFNMTSKDFQNRKEPCPYCQKTIYSLGMKKAQEKVDKKHNGLFKLCGEYKNMHEEIPIICNSCSSVFEDSVSSLIAKSRCPKCKARNLK